ncbi:hypothetical protein [Microbacterium sp. VKM Ac-2923]|uniref:hypothetical protein n=1 Tax=Microbacterium sp. VKM Ac-2923 TaxID=2929476 RepID=UPI001FB1B628|nr:hypothetical protein [Microbacterium sp. VKM Ac-2923]MCJ1709289.1 hypothetical protein [Microbacterium sp. VKM Ac-2923]
MIRSLILVLGVFLVMFGSTYCVLRLTADGWAAIALLGLILVILANRWDTLPR